MTSKTLTIEAANGLHARPVSELVKLAKSLGAVVYIATPCRQAMADSMLGILSLGLKKGTEITISAEGNGEEDAVNAVAGFIMSVKE